MSKNVGISKGVKIYFTGGVIAAIIFNLYAIFKSPILAARIGGCYGIISSALAIIYGIKGFGKDAAKYYKLFAASAFLTFQLSASTAGIRTDGVFAGVMVAGYCLMAAFTMALILSRDMGKKYSLALCWSMVGVTLAIAVAMMCIYPGVVIGGTEIGSVATYRAFSNSFLAQVLLVMTMAKYQDKAARGTK